MGVTVDKQGKINIGLGALVSSVIALATAYPVARGALAGELQDLVKKQMQPLSDAMEIQTANSIRSLADSISAFRFKQSTCGATPGCWTVDDQRKLDQAIRDLDTAEKVLQSLRANR